MSHEKQTGHQSEKSKSLTFKELQYNDGQIALGLETPGEQIILGADSNFKWGQVHRGSMDMALVRTKSGNAYGLGQGVVINFREQKAFIAPDELPPIVIGDSWTIPGVGHTSDVESVWFRYKTGPAGYSRNQIDKPSPFVGLAADIEAVLEHNPHI